MLAYRIWNLQREYRVESKRLLAAGIVTATLQGSLVLPDECCFGCDDPSCGCGSSIASRSIYTDVGGNGLASFWFDFPTADTRDVCA